MAVLLRLAGQTLGDGLHGCFAVAIARRISPIEDGADALADAARGLRFRQPDFRQEVADHRAGYLVDANIRSEEHTSELQSLMRISYAAFCLKKKKHHKTKTKTNTTMHT